MKFFNSLSQGWFYAIVLVLLLIFSLVLWGMGRPLICECNYIRLWHSGLGPQGSQHLLDWFTLSHVVHGFLFYGIISWFFPGMPKTKRVVLAIIVEMSWEVFENSPWFIEYYRTHTVAVQYVGDSVINSVMDVIFMIGGALYARHFPTWSAIMLAILLELAALVAVRDNFVLNVLMFVYPIEAIQEWQIMR